MATRSTGRRPPVVRDAVEIFKALADPIRFYIVREMCLVDELACTKLEDTLPISKATISYHIKVLYLAGLLTIRKQGRHYFYTLRPETIDALVPGFSERIPLMEGAWQPE